MTTTTPFQAVTANFITSYVGRPLLRHPYRGRPRGRFSRSIKPSHSRRRRSYSPIVSEAIEGEEEHRNVGAAFAMDPGSAA